MSRQQILIIGAAGGVGRELSRQLSADGWDLVLAGRQQASLDELAMETGGEVEVLDATCFEATDDLLKRYPDLRAAVNLAGSIMLKSAHQTSQDDFNDTISQNLTTAFSLVRACGNHRRRGGGSVVLMSTCAARLGLMNHEAIAAAKAGVEGLTRTAAATYASRGIRFNAVAPGLVDTPLAQPITSSEPALKASTAMHPLGRIGNPEEVARLIGFLLNPVNDWITGQVIGIDGGLATVRGR